MKLGQFWLNTLVFYPDNVSLISDKNHTTLYFTQKKCCYFIFLGVNIAHISKKLDLFKIFNQTRIER